MENFPAYGKSQIEAIQYHVFPGTTLTACCITLKGGAHVIGYSDCINPAEFNAETGMNCAYDKALDKAFEVMAVEVKRKLNQ